MVQIAGLLKMVEISRYSGYRLVRDTQKDNLPQAWYQLRSNVEKLVPLVQSMNIGTYLDDSQKNWNPLDLLMAKVHEGELYVSYSNGEFVGIAAICDIEYGRNGWFDAWTPESKRGSPAIGWTAGELMTYCFKPYPEGLGLTKLKARIARGNDAALGVVKKMGFLPCGIERAQELHNGVPTDTITLELLNPAWFKAPIEVISSGSTGQSAVSTDTVHERGVIASIGGESVREPTESTVDHSSSADWPTDSRTSERDDGSGSELAESEQLQRDEQPVSTGRTRRPIRSTVDEPNGKLVQPKHNAAASSIHAGTAAKPGTKLRKLRSSASGTDTSAGKSKRTYKRASR